MISQVTPWLFKLELPSHTFPPFSHTNSYMVIHKGQAVIIDPGFYQQKDLEILLELLETTQTTLQAVLLTHAHQDHQEGIPLLQQTFSGLPLFVHPLEQNRLKAKPIQPLGSRFSLEDLQLDVLFTPGHSPGHVSFYVEGVAIVGDMVAGYGSTWIGLPDGNYRDYFSSLELLSKLNLKILAPGHGPILTRPYQKLDEVKKHRLNRLEQVFRALSQASDLDTLCQKIYPDLEATLHNAAKHSLLALLANLEENSRIENLGKDLEGPYKQKAALS